MSFLVLFQPVRAITTSFLFFFNDTATTEIYTLSLHDALPISRNRTHGRVGAGNLHRPACRGTLRCRTDAATLCLACAFRVTKVRVSQKAQARQIVAASVRQRSEIGRAHVLTPVTRSYRMPSSA